MPLSTEPPGDGSRDGCQPFPIEGSSCAARYCLEAAEIQALKWIESEKAGHDIGLPRSMWLWYTTHRALWIAAMRARGVPGF